MAQAAIALRDLTRRFGAFTAVDRVTLDVAPGELFGLVGPDGAGKTTTLRMLAGVLRPSAGDALVGGVSVARNREGVKHHIGYMSQRFGLYTDLTVRENIDFSADLYEVPPGERAARLERLYHFSSLGPFEDRLAGQLSGGMKQKLGLCCALVHQPQILLLDEPTFGVDPISRRDLWLILHEMVAQGVTVLVSTAYMDEAERCDHVALLDKGRLLALDTPQALKAGVPGNNVIEVQFSHTPELWDERLRKLGSVHSVQSLGNDAYRILSDEGSLTTTEMVTMALAEQVQVEGARQIEERARAELIAASLQDRGGGGITHDLSDDAELTTR